MLLILRYAIVWLLLLLSNGWTVPIFHYDVIKCKGLPEDICPDVIKCLKQLKVKYAHLKDIELSESDLEDSVMFGDLILTPEQCQSLLSNAEAELQEKEEEDSEVGSGATREKRKAVNFVSMPYRKWDLPIRYAIDSRYYSSTQMKTIRNAFAQWQERTCIRFQEVALGYAGQHIRVTSWDGCFTSLGKTAYPDHVISLKARGCLYNQGTAVHEIGHALGLIHEQSRPDRDKYVNILEQNIKPDFLGQFYRSRSTVVHGVPYDYASVMHYGAYDFTRNGRVVIEAVNSKYEYTFGQRVEASFMDVTIVNRMYGCLDPTSANSPAGCQNPTVTCYNKGYPDPGNDCQSCRCPDGMGGDCRAAAEGSTGCTPLSGLIDVTSTQEQCVNSPRYGSTTYRYGEHCSWLLQAPEGRTIMLYFDRTKGFGVYHQDECMHWVEIKHNGNLTESGPRYCGSSRNMYNQKEVVTSQTNKVGINFNSDHNTGNRYSYLQKGFKLCFKLTGSDPTTTMSSSSTTTTPTTSTKTPTTTTTTTSTTTPTTTSTTTSTTSTTTTPASAGAENNNEETTISSSSTITASTTPSTTTSTSTSTSTTSTMSPTTTSTSTSTSTLTTTQPQAISDSIICLVCSHKYNQGCTDEKFLQQCPADTQGCYSQVFIKPNGYPLLTVKGCIKNCAVPGAMKGRKYCCKTPGCNGPPKYIPPS